MIVILAYHSIGYNIKDKYCITPKIFKKQLSYLNKKFNIISLGGLTDILNNYYNNKKKYAIITFDDGRQDNYKYAFPILKKMNIPITIFLSTGLIGDKVSTINGAAKMLTLSEIKEMQNSKIINFESHTQKHIILRNISNNILEEELGDSKKYLKDKLGIDSKYFVYPKAKFDNSAKKLVKKYYRFAFGSTGIIFKKNNLDLYNLPRITIHNKISFLKFKLLLTKIFWLLKKYD